MSLILNDRQLAQAVDWRADRQAPRPPATPFRVLHRHKPRRHLFRRFSKRWSASCFRAVPAPTPSAVRLRRTATLLFRKRAGLSGILVTGNGATTFDVIEVNIYEVRWLQFAVPNDYGILVSNGPQNNTDSRHQVYEEDMRFREMRIMK